MLEPMSGMFKKKAGELGLERADQLGAIQKYLDSLYPGQCRALSLNDGVLRVTTPNSSVASELRMRQPEILSSLKDIKRLVIQIA